MSTLQFTLALFLPAGNASFYLFRTPEEPKTPLNATEPALFFANGSKVYKKNLMEHELFFPPELVAELEESVQSLAFNGSSALALVSNAVFLLEESGNASLVGEIPRKLGQALEIAVDWLHQSVIVLAKKSEDFVFIDCGQGNRSNFEHY